MPLFGLKAPRSKPYCIALDKGLLECHFCPPRTHCFLPSSGFQAQPLQPCVFPVPTKQPPSAFHLLLPSWEMLFRPVPSRLWMLCLLSSPHVHTHVRHTRYEPNRSFFLFLNNTCDQMIYLHI